ncbi:hypothetical protein KKC08_03200, partial [Patescibacteria group bacterium]|nr:hypothetical protein [Patescibacteria group bacterium]
LEAKEEGRGGLSGKYHQIESLVRALEGLPKDVEWGNAGLNELTLAALESIGVAGSINEIGRLDYYASSSAGGLAGAMLRSIDDWQDGGAVFRKEVLDKHEASLTQIREEHLKALMEKEYLSLERRDIAMGYREEEGEDGRKEKVYYGDEEVKSWVGDMARTVMTIEEMKTKMRQLGFDPEVKEAEDFFTLIGCTPEKASEVLSNERIVNDRREVQYWLGAEIRGFNSLVDYYSAVIKAISDLGSSAELLTKPWNDKPPNTEMFGILKSPEMDLAVTAVFQTLLDMDVVDVEYVEKWMETTSGESVLVKEPRIKEKGYLADYGLDRSAFNKKHTPEERRLWLDGLRRCVRDKLKKSNVKSSFSWANQAVPIGIAFYEIMLLGSRAGTRRDKNGDAVRVVKEINVKIDGKDKKRVLLDHRGWPIYEAEEGGPATVTGWLNDLEEKAFRTHDRFLKEGWAGHAAPSPLIVFGTPTRFLQSMFEKEEIEVGDVKMSMLDAVRMGKATVGQCFAKMTEGDRAIEALNLYRAVGAIEAMPATPLARLDVVFSEKSADDKFLEETVKYFTVLKKALGMVFPGELWKVNVVLANTVSTIVRYAKRTDPAEGGNKLASTEEWDFSAWFDQTFRAVRNKLCFERPEMDYEVFDLGWTLGKTKGAKTRDVLDAGQRRQIRVNDLVGMILFEDAERDGDLMERLSRNPKENPYSVYARVARHGPDGDAYDPERQRDERMEAVNALLKEVKRP